MDVYPKVICEVSAYTIRGVGICRPHISVWLWFVDIKAIAENDLLCGGVNMQRTIFFDNEIELLIVVAAVYTQPLEHIGIIG